MLAFIVSLGEAMTDLNSLALFAKVVEAGSFSEAARRLKMPISTVSRRIAELEAVESVVSNRLSDVSGTLKLSAPPSVSDTLLTPLVTAFQASYPNVRVQILVTERLVDLIAEGVDLAFRLGALKDSCLVVRRILTYRHQLVASPSYLKAYKPPQGPQDLLDHRLLTFSHWKPENSWTFVHKNGMDKETLTFQPHFSMNDYTGLAPALAAGAGIGELPPVVQPGLIREGLLVEVIPDWRLRTYDLSLVQVGNRHITKPCRLFKDLAVQMAPSLFPDLPT
jgi:DNA-binding transcriptional LysR family regulator